MEKKKTASGGGYLCAIPVPGRHVSAVAYIFSCFLANKFKIFATVEIELKDQTDANSSRGSPVGTVLACLILYTNASCLRTPLLCLLNTQICLV